jgi:hypothetical protein
MAGDTDYGINWKQLKDFCNALPEEQLEKRVILWREDECINSIYANELDEDQYMHDEDEEGCYPLSQAEHPEHELKKVYEKGHPVLIEDF